MSLPVLQDWDETRRALHQVAQVMGVVRREVATPQPNWVHLGLQVTKQGWTTGELPIGELVLDASVATLTYRGAQIEQTIALGIIPRLAWQRLSGN